MFYGSLLQLSQSKLYLKFRKLADYLSFKNFSIKHFKHVVKTMKVCVRACARVCVCVYVGYCRSLAFLFNCGLVLSSSLSDS